jgi:hypothetical protein
MPHSLRRLPCLLLILPLLSGAPARADDTPRHGPAAPASETRVMPLDLRAEAPRPEADPNRLSDSVVVGGRQDEPPWYHTGYGWQTPPQEAPDWPGLKRDTSYFMIYQLAVIGVLYTMPASVTNWDKDELDGGRLLSKWWDNVTAPEWDEDDWWINYLAHPYWGATYYIRGRERGLDKTQSFLYSALLSTLYEFTFEAVAEPVSYQDFFVTPIFGALLGEYLFSPMRERIRAKPGALSWSDKTVLFLTDPLGVMSAWTDRARGVESRLTLHPVGGDLPPPAANPHADPEGPPRDVLAAQGARPWGVQWEVHW